MKYMHHLFIIISFLCASLCNAMMENQNKVNFERKLDILGEVTIFNNSSGIWSCGKYCLIQDGRDRSTIVDPIDAGALFKPISEFGPLHVAVHPDNDRIAFFTENHTLTLYNVKEQKEEECNTALRHSASSIGFNPYDKTIMFCTNSRLVEYNYQTKKARDIEDNNADGYYRLAMHPKENSICLTSQAEIILGTVNNGVLLVKQKIAVPTTALDFFKYTADGSYIVVGNQSWIYRVDLEKSIWGEICCAEMDGTYKCMQLHPTGVLAVLSDYIVAKNSPLFVDKKYVLNYWDIVTQQLVCSHKLDVLFIVYCFDFFNDGKEIVFATHRACVRAAVPFEVLYRLFSKEEFLQLLLFLKRFEERGDLTQDVVNHCMQNLIERCKR